ncbi:MAG TPA: NAD(P)/FAD-dependent oxidoreductase [Acidimicrobiia bacterium]|jgi:phytoene dehydrogenase-like protein
MSEHDVVIAGAGHNSLVTAAYLAKAGFSVVVLEAQTHIGGDAATAELTLPGYLHDSCSTAHTLLQGSPLIANDELRLADYGLEYIRPDPVVHIPFPDGTSITMWRDIERTISEFAAFSSSDAAAYRAMIDDYASVAPAFGKWRNTPIGRGPSLDEHLALIDGGHRWQRIRQWSAADIVNRHFEHPHTRAFMMWMSLMTMQPPQRAGTGQLAYSLAFGRQRHSWIVPRGGSGQLPAALGRIIEEHGGTILTDRKISSLIIEGGRCVGVETESGETFRGAKAVMSTIHVKHLVDMAPAELWGEQYSYGVATWRAGISMCAAHYATEEPPTFADGLTPLASGTPTTAENVLRIAGQFERGEVVLEDPVLLVLCPTVVDESRAPAGKHTLKVVGVQPYELAGGPEAWDDLMPRVAAANLDHLRRYAPNLTEEKFLATCLKSPLDLERMNPHNWHGSCHGGDMSADQSGTLRPAAGWADHRTPIPGLYQTGSTTHPGGSVSAGPGRNAAMILLEDLGSTLEAAIG